MKYKRKDIVGINLNPNKGDEVGKIRPCVIAMVAIRHNDKMKVFYERLKDNGKHTTLAQVAVMRKLIVVAFSLYKQEVEYSEDRYMTDCGIETKESDSLDVVEDNNDNTDNNNNKIDTICHNKVEQQIEKKVEQKNDVEKEDKQNIRSKNKRNRKKEIGLSA